MTTSTLPELLLGNPVVDTGDGTLRTVDGGIYCYHAVITSLDLYPHETERPIVSSSISLRAAWHPSDRVHVAYIAGCPVHRRAHLDQLLEEVTADLALASVYLTFCVDSRSHILRFGPFNLVRYTDQAEALAAFQSLVAQLLPLHPCSA